MVLEELKHEVEKLTAEERHELSVYLTRIQLDTDEEFWKAVRERSEDKDPENWVNIDDIK